MPKCSLLLLGVLMALLSCTSDRAIREYLTGLPPRDPAEVEILWSKPDVEFDIVAEIQSRRESAMDMQRYAAERGADAVIVVTMGASDYSSHDVVTRDPNDRTKAYTRIVGTAIRYRR